MHERREVIKGRREVNHPQQVWRRSSQLYGLIRGKLCRATALEKEKKDLEGALHRKVLEFENERSSLQTRIQTMCEDLKMRTEAQAKVDQLEVSVLLFSALFKN